MAFISTQCIESPKGIQCRHSIKALRERMNASPTHGNLLTAITEALVGDYFLMLILNLTTACES